MTYAPLDFVDLEELIATERELKNSGRDKVFSFDEHEAEVQAAKAAAFEDGVQQGFQQGLEQARQEVSSQVVDALGSLGPMIETIHSEMESHQNELELSILDFVGNIIQKLLPELSAKISPKEVEAIIRRYLKKFIGVQSILVKVHPDLVAPLGEVFANEIKKGAIEFFSNQEAESFGDVSVVWDNGFVDYNATAIKECILMSLQKIDT